MRFYISCPGFLKKQYSTFEELFFEIRNEEPGSVNVYTVIRDGKEVEINITNGRLGLPKVLRRPSVEVRQHSVVL